MKKGTKPRPVPQGPFLLELVLSNRCNLDCAYCSSAFVLKEKRRRVFSFEELKRAVDLYAACLKREGLAGSGLISFTGNEPLLEFDLLKRVVRYVRSRGLPMRLDTNGTLLDPEKAAFLRDNGVRIFVSLDGCRRAQDRHRRFHDGRSSFETVRRNLERLPPAAAGDGVCVWAVVTPETAALLPESLEFFSGLNAGSVTLCLETYSSWNSRDLARLRAFLRSFKAAFPASLARESAAGRRPPRVLFGLSEAADPRGIIGKAVSLSFDGRFYPCDFALIPPFGPAASLGDLRSGLDLRRLDAVLRLPMFRRIAAGCRRPDGLRAPVERFYWGLAKGYSAARLDRELADTSRVNEIFHEEMDGFLLLQAAWERLSADRAFGDLDHRPKYAAAKETRRLRLAVAAGSAPAKLRAAVDFLLYSPGRDKRLVLAAGPGAGRAAEGIRAYALLKACRLGKRLRVGTEA